MKTSELIRPALDWAVAKCVGKDPTYFKDSNTVWIGSGFSGYTQYSPSTSWVYGGLIIDEMDISWSRCHDDTFIGHTVKDPEMMALTTCISMKGETKLIAAMRCYVASKLGDEVDVPKELL